MTGRPTPRRRPGMPVLVAMLAVAGVLAGCGTTHYTDLSRAEMADSQEFAAALDSGGEEAEEAAAAFVGDFCDFAASEFWGDRTESQITGFVQLTTAVANARQGSTAALEAVRNRIDAIRGAVADAAPGDDAQTLFELTRRQVLATIDPLLADDPGGDPLDRARVAAIDVLGLPDDPTDTELAGAYLDLAAAAEEEIRDACGDDVADRLDLVDLTPADP